MVPEPDERELARRARDGDREALSELVERVRMRLFAVAYAELRHYDDAQDAVASALLRICRHLGDLREPERALAWMCQVTRNEARRRRLGRAGEPALLADVDEAPAAESGSALLRLDVELALRRLPRDEARALALFYLERRSIEEIARHTGRPEGTIKRWLHRGRRLLADEMEEYAPMAARRAKRAAPAAMTAAIISTELDDALVQQMSAALRQAGFGDIATCGDVAYVATQAGEGLDEWRLARPLQGRRLIILDEWIGGRSAFEIHSLLKAVPELHHALFWMLAAAPVRDQTVTAAWASGVECFVTKPFDLGEFAVFAERLHAKLKEQDQASAQQAGDAARKIG